MANDLFGMPLNERLAEYTSGLITFIRELTSPAYFQKACASLHGDRIKHYYGTTDIDADVDIKMADGSVSYNRTFSCNSVSDVRKAAYEYVYHKPIYSLDSFVTIDKELGRKFELFVDFLQSKSIEVVFFLPAYCPIVYRYLSESREYRIVNEVEEYVRRFADNQHISVIGSFNPSLTGFTDDDFYDGMHPRRSAVARLFRHESVFTKH